MEGHDQLPKWKQPWVLLSSLSTPRYRQLGEGEDEAERYSTGFISKEFASEVKRVNYIAWPMIVVSVSQHLLRLSPIFVLGHVGALPLSGAAMATTFCNITGFSVIEGMAGALETLCGQAYGAGQYKQVGNFTHAAVMCLLVVSLPISLLWVFANKLFIFIGQDPLISNEAGNYAVWLLPSLFAFCILQTLTRYLQIQKLMFPILVSSVASLLFDVFVCWGLVFKLKLGSAGAALSIGLSYWFNVALLLVYVKYSPACKKTHASFSKEVFSCLGKFFRCALPSAMMVCLSWWCFELILLLSGILPNPMIEVNVISISLTITALHFNVPNSFGAAASTRISNELGAGNPQAAQLAVRTAVILSAAEVVFAVVALFNCRRILGYAFIKEKEVIVYIQRMTPFICLSMILDSLQAVLSGVARGGGWQQIAAYVNLGAYYAVGIPVSLIMGFMLKLRGEGLWMGLVAGAAVQCFFLSLVTGLTDWDKKATEARVRIFGGEIPPQIQLT